MGGGCGLSAIKDYLAICCLEQWVDGLFCHIIREGDALKLDTEHHAGAFCLPPVDSREKGFSWSRLVISAELPQDCGMRVYAHTSDDRDWQMWGTLRTAFAEDGATSDTLRECFGPPLSPGKDVWMSLSGRYLWLAFELTATGEGQPTVSGFAIRMRGDHMRDYLPVIYQEDDFTLRFLSIFNSMMQDMEDAVEALPRQLDPESAPDGMLECLAEWLCVEPGDGQVRERMRSALREYESMYTPEGIKRSVRRLTGREPLIIEHFSVDPNREDCRNPALYRRLYGDKPSRFFVLLDKDAFASRDRMEWFLAHMQNLIPAGTELELVLLTKCVQLDWHTYLGINSCVGSYVPAVINETVTIHYDTTIGGAAT